MFPICYLNHGAVVMCSSARSGLRSAGQDSLEHCGGFFQTGVFFGEAEGAVMSKLVSMGSFTRYVHENHQLIFIPKSYHNPLYHH